MAAEVGSNGANLEVALARLGELDQPLEQALANLERKLGRAIQVERDPEGHITGAQYQSPKDDKSG